MERKKKDKPTEVAVFIVIILIGFLLSWLFSGLIMTLILDNVHFDISHLFSYMLHPLTFLITGLLLAIAILYYVYLKIKKGKKKGPEAERSDSSLYDDSNFLKGEDLDRLYGIQIGKNKFSPHLVSNILNDEVSGLIINSGFTKKNEYYYHVANKLHNLVIGTTGTGKTKYLLTPSILMMAKSKTKPSLIVIDIKGDIISKTYNVLNQNGYDTHILDLRNPLYSEKYNPLDIIIDYFDSYIKDKKNNKEDKYKYESEINKLAELIVPSEKGSDAFWASAAQNVFKGILYGMLEDYEDNIKSPKEKGFKRTQFTFASIYNINSLTSEEFREFFLRRPNSSPARKLVAANVLSNYEPTGQMNRTLSSIMSTYVTDFNKFIDSSSIDLTLRSDFSVKDIRSKPTAIYLLLPDEEVAKYPLASVIINQIYSLCVTDSQKEDFKNIKRDVHFLLDEFANLPKFPTIDNWLSIGRERRIFISIFVQAMSQLEDKYGKEYTKTILQNCNMKIIMGLGETNSIDYFKHLFGTYTVKSSSASTGFRENSDSTSASLQKADLIQSTRFMKMKPGEIYFIELKQSPAHTNIVPLFDEKFKLNVHIKDYALKDRKKAESLELDEYVYNPYDSTVVEEMISNATALLTSDMNSDSNTGTDGVNIDDDGVIGF